jgi:hypothetical protein
MNHTEFSNTENSVFFIKKFCRKNRAISKILRHLLLNRQMASKISF